MRPLPPPADPDAVLELRLARWLRLARAAVLWERLWPLVLPPLCLIGLFVALALFDVLPLLPGWLHALLLAGVAGGTAFLTTRAALRLKVPTVDQGARRLERDSGLDHRPLAALADRPVTGDDPVAEALWQIHRRRMTAMVRRLRIALPHPNMAARDPWGFRAAVFLLLVIAGTVGGSDSSRRLARALDPAITAPGIGPDAVEVWITPPAYTGVAPLLLRPGQPVSVPAGSAVLAVLSGGWGTASLAVDGNQTPFQRQSDGSQRLESQLQASTQLIVRQAGLTVASWQVAVVADSVPSIDFTMPPEPGERGRLRLTATASDDYGLAKAWVEMRRLGAPDDEAVVVDLPLSNGRPRVADIASWSDLTAHPWAGLPVSLQPVAEDAIGQRGGGEIHAITLPERSFTNPVAAALVEQRRQLTEDRRNAARAMGLLDRVASEPQLFNDDLKTFLILRAARHAMDNQAFALAEVQELLWNGALRIEEGDLASAEKALEEARRALEQAMDANAPAADLQRLLDQFQQAMQRYVEALAERMAANNQPQPVPNADGRTISDEELQQMVEGMRDMAETGSRDALRQMLQDLSQILDGLQAGAQQQAANGPAAQGMQGLRDLARRQQQMLDQTHQRAQQESGGQPGGSKGEAGGGSGNGAQAAQAQETLRRTLGEVARKLGEGLGEAPHALSEAGEAMAESAAELGRNQWDGAAQAQAQALQLMQQAAREAMEQMGQAGQGTSGLVPRDPLGRPARGAGSGDDGTTRVPDRSEIQRSRDLLNEIRRRAGEFQRPGPERDYLHRLLKQF